MNAHEAITHLAKLKKPVLLDLCRMLSVQVRQRKKKQDGGGWRCLRVEELQREIRRAVANTFPDRLERIARRVAEVINE